MVIPRSRSSGEAFFSERVSDRCGECGFAVVNVTDCSDVYVRLIALE